jgi:hypothetical protein
LAFICRSIINSLTNFNAGISLRAGPVFLGSGSVITALIRSLNKLHFGIRWKHEEEWQNEQRRYR